MRVPSSEFVQEVRGSIQFLRAERILVSPADAPHYKACASSPARDERRAVMGVIGDRIRSGVDLAQSPGTTVHRPCDANLSLSPEM